MSQIIRVNNKGVDFVCDVIHVRERAITANLVILRLIWLAGIACNGSALWSTAGNPPNTLQLVSDVKFIYIISCYKSRISIVIKKKHYQMNKA